MRLISLVSSHHEISSLRVQQVYMLCSQGYGVLKGVPPQPLTGGGCPANQRGVLSIRTLFTVNDMIN
jgi:hypothetical protein